MQLPILRSKLAHSFKDRENIVPISDVVSDVFNDDWLVPFGAWGRFWPKTNQLIEGWFPKMDMSETDAVLKIKLNIPNVDPKKINIELDHSTLVVSGKTEEEKKEEGENWTRTEREMGEFKRVVSLPDNVNTDAIKATAQHGTIVIMLPKVEVQRKKVNVEVT